jgi:uncharacterized protein
MQAPPEPNSETCQSWFHRRWRELGDPHVRTLAWLLDAPNLLDVDAVQWQGKVASLGPLDEQAANWLAELDCAPKVLHDYLDVQPHTRLGRYAEKLMAFYLQQRSCLVAHGVQVKTDKGLTIGEFDFLVRIGDALLHWEFATKLYLLEASGKGAHADYFVGPNLADTLGIKIRKIMDQQLSLSAHPAASQHLPAPITGAQALVKGWLFYHGNTPLQPAGIARAHCRGFWCTVAELDRSVGVCGMVLPRLAWLAPVKANQAEVMNLDVLRRNLRERFERGGSSMPILIALLVEREGEWLEIERGFIVPDDWRHRAGQRLAAVS